MTRDPALDMVWDSIPEEPQCPQCHGEGSYMLPWFAESFCIVERIACMACGGTGLLRDVPVWGEPVQEIDIGDISHDNQPLP